MYEVLCFWMDCGVDGFCVDVIYNIGKDLVLFDVEEWIVKILYLVLNDELCIYELLCVICKTIDVVFLIMLFVRPEQRGGRMMVGEVFLLSIE